MESCIARAEHSAGTRRSNSGDPPGTRPPVAVGYEPMTGEPAPTRPPLGSWPLLYATCCALAVVVMALLYWFTAHFNVRLGG